MFPIPSLITVAKYGFISMVVTSAGFLIGNVIVMKHHTVEPLDDLLYKPRISRQLEDAAPGLEREYSKCFTEPTKTFCARHANEPFRTSDFAGEREREEDVLAPPGGIRRHSLHTLLVEFSEYMNSLGIQAVILEPSMLFCAVSPSNKYNLLMKDFNPHYFQGSYKTVTLGIFEDDAKILDATIWVQYFWKRKEQLGYTAPKTILRLFNVNKHRGLEASQNKTLKSRFEASRSRKWLIDTELSALALYSVHFLFARGSLQVHVVVLFERNNYLWHSGTNFTSRELLFTKEGTYENFTSIPLVVKSDPELQLYLPTNPAQFLFQIPNSEVLYCQPSADEMKTFPHPTLTQDQVINRAVIAIQELKASFQPHFVNFWLWTESLSGWYLACNVFQKTFELNIAVFHSSVKRLNLTEIWANNYYLQFSESYSTDEKYAPVILDCYGLRINIFISHEEREMVWYHQKSEEDADSKRVIPFKFRLCSSDVLGQRVYVPCEAGLIIDQQTRLAEVTTTNTLDLH